MKKQTKLISMLLLLTGSLFAIETDATPNKWVAADQSVVIAGTATTEAGCVVNDYKWRINSEEGNTWLTADARYDGTGTIKFVPADFGYGEGDVARLILRAEDSCGNYDSDELFVTVTSPVGDIILPCVKFDVNEIANMWVAENGSVMTTPTATSDTVTTWRYRISINGGDYATVQEGTNPNFKFIPSEHGAVAGDVVDVVVRAMNDDCDEKPHDSEAYQITVTAATEY